MQLYFVRHAIAMEREAFDGDDSERPLTAEGKEKMRRIAKGLQTLKPGFEVLLSSPYRRAQETADLLAAQFQLRRHLQFTDALKPKGNRPALIREIAALEGRAESVALVGHEPYLSTLAATLIFGQPTAGLAMKKGGVLKLTLDHIRLGRCAELEWLLTPRQLMALAA